MVKVIGKILIVMIMMVFLLGGYILWDNNRIIVVKEDIMIHTLSEELEGFKILQISDLHEKEFGKDQKRFIKKINKIDYDVMVITGDILTDPGSENYESFYTFLEGIENKEHLLFVPGNSDPPSYQVTSVFDKSVFISGMEDRGVRFLESFDTIDVEGESIHFVNFELAIVRKPEQIGNVNGMVRPFHASNEEYQAYQRKLWEDMQAKDILNSDDTLIALNHHPVADARFDYIEADPTTEMKEFDLIMAGHYHGGQIRIPFYGALFIPDPWYEPNSLYPPQDRVKGLWEYKGRQQYVSAGLASSESSPLLKFRLFNPPEINLLTLKSK